MRLPIFLCSLALFVGAAHADAIDAMQPTFGNTLIVVRSDGLETHTYYAENRSFEGRIPALEFLYKGTWDIDTDGNLCRWFNPPFPGRSNPDCQPISTHTVGDTWTTDDGMTISLVAGIQ